MLTNNAYVPAIYNTGIVRGDYYSEVFTFTAEGQALSLDNATMRVQVRDRSGKLLDEFTQDDGLTVDGNEVNWVIPSATTATYTPDSYLYDWEITTSGQTRTYVAGTFQVLKDITYA